MSVYDASDIRVLPGLEAVRQRPAMYIGSTDVEGLHHLVYEVVDNAIDESLAGHCSDIRVTLGSDGSCSVTDNGRGIPVEAHPQTGRPACEVVLTTLHAGAKFSSGSYTLSGGTHGVGVSCVNALSSWLVLDVWRGERHFRQRFAAGRVESEVEDLGAASQHGTRVHFLPDAEIFEGAGPLSAERLAQRLEVLSFLNPGVRIHLEDLRTDQTVSFENTGGLAAFVKHLNRDRSVLHAPPIWFQQERHGISVEIALQWTTAYAEETHSFVNSIHTGQGGCHVDGLNAALWRVVNRVAREQQMLSSEADEVIHSLDVREGLTCVLSLRMLEPHFGGQTKSRLTSPEAQPVVEEVVLDGFYRHLSTHPQVISAIVGKALEASRARAAARRASERARYQAVDPLSSEDVYKKQFGIRSSNWHESCTWLTDDDLLAEHAAHVRMGPDARVLDVCCGSGVVGAALKPRVGRVEGLDLTPQMRKLAGTRLDEVHAGNVYSIPFEANTFDGVCTREVLHLLPQPERPVSEIFRVLKPGGQFIVGQILPYGVEDAAWMFRIFKKKQPLVYNQWLDYEFHQMLADAGFVGIEMTELQVWESIDLWIDTWETTNLHRHEIRDLFYNAPRNLRGIHPFEVLPDGGIRDCWRWCIFSAFKPS